MQKRTLRILGVIAGMLLLVATLAKIEQNSAMTDLVYDLSSLCQVGVPRTTIQQRFRAYGYEVHPIGPTPEQDYVSRGTFCKWFTTRHFGAVIRYRNGLCISWQLDTGIGTL